MSSHALILKLVEEGVITAEQAAELQNKMKRSRGYHTEPVRRVNLIKVRLDDLSREQTIVEAEIPVEVVKIGIIPAHRVWSAILERYPDLRNFKINFREIYSCIEKDEPGPVVDQKSGDGCKRLQVCLR